MENFKGLRDNPIYNKDEENLGLTDYAVSLSDFILICDTPITIAIQGDWGSGKTSMMNMISDIIKHKTICIPFNSWQFSQFDLESYLHVTLLNQFLEKIGATESLGEFTKKVGMWMTKLAKTALVATADKTLGGTVAGAVKDEIFTGDPTEIIKEIANLKDKVQKVLHKRLKEQDKDRAVVFIDDLDRLAPEKAVELLEVLKIFLDIDQCVFVLAVDYKVVSQGLKKKFGEEIDAMKGKSFFDKIIQLPFNMPVSRYDANTYIEKILTDLQIVYHSEDVNVYRNLIESSIGFNPRSIKRLFNSFLLVLSVARKKNLFKEDKIASLEEKLKLLFGIQCMQTAWEEMYYFIIKNTTRLDDQFFLGLKDEDRLQHDLRYTELLKKIPSEELFKIADFMGVFYQVIQLQSDNNSTVSQQEIWNLIELIQFSSITSRDSSIVQESSSVSYDWDLVKSVAVKISQQLNYIYNDQLQDHKGYLSGFGFWPSRWGVNNQHEKFRVFLKFFHRSENWLHLNFFLEEGFITFKIYSGHISLKKLLKETVDSINVNSGPDFKYVENLSEFLCIWRKPISEYASENIDKHIIELVKPDLDKILPLLLEKIDQMLPKNKIRIKFFDDIRKRVFKKLNETQTWALDGHFIIGNVVKIQIEHFNPDGEQENGYGSWWGIYDPKTDKGICLGSAPSCWEGFTINNVDDFRYFIEGNEEIEKLEKNPEQKERTLEFISEYIVQKVRTGLTKMN